MADELGAMEHQRRKPAGTKWAILVLAGVVLFLARLVASQNPSTGLSNDKAFEVAVIKPARPDGRLANVVEPSGRYVATSITLRTLLLTAYGLSEDQLSGGPRWMDSDKFDVLAKPESTASRTDVLAMLRSLLSQRFKVAVHEETRDAPMYAMVLDKPGRLGSQIAVSVACEGLAKPMFALSDARLGRSQDTPMPCNFTRTGPGFLIGRYITLERVAAGLKRFVERDVTNDTGLAGRFDLTLQWASVQGVSPAQNTTEFGLPIYAAIEQQLGFKLESRRGPKSIVVVDRAEMPEFE